MNAPSPSDPKAEKSVAKAGKTKTAAPRRKKKSASTPRKRPSSTQAAKNPDASDGVGEWLVRVEQAGPNGLAISSAERTRLQKLGAFEFFAAAESTESKKDAGSKPPTPLVLNEAGRAKLTALREAQWRDQARTLSGLCDLIAEHSRKLDALQADGAVLARVVQDGLAAMAEGGDGHAKSGARFAPSSADFAALQEAAVARIPSGHWQAIPELFARLRHDGFAVLPGQLTDILLALESRGRIAFNVWEQALREIPQPEHGILQPEATVIYYVRRNET